MAERQRKAPTKSAFQEELARAKQEREQKQLVAQRKESMENKRNILNAKLKEAVDKYIDYSQAYDEQDMRVQFQLTTISLLKPLTEFVEVVVNMEETMSLLDESMTLVEDSMSLIDQYVEPSRHQETGLFARFRAKQRTKRFMKLWKGRLQQMQGVMEAMNSGVQLITKEMSSMMASMNGGGKSKNQPANEGLNAKTQKLIDDRKRERGIETAQTAGDDDSSARASGGFDENAAPPSLDGLL